MIRSFPRCGFCNNFILIIGSDVICICYVHAFGRVLFPAFHHNNGARQSNSCIVALFCLLSFLHCILAASFSQNFSLFSSSFLTHLLRYFFLQELCMAMVLTLPWNQTTPQVTHTPPQIVTGSNACTWPVC